MTSFSVTAAAFVPMSMRNASAAPAPPSQDPISMFNSQMSELGQAGMGGMGHSHHHSSHSHGHGADVGPSMAHMNGGGGGGGAYGTKATVCTPFFRQGACGDPSCRFAHCLSELEYGAQQQLISMAGGEEFLPAHFTHGMYQQAMPSAHGGRGLFSASGPATPSGAMGGGRSLGVGPRGGGGGGHNGGGGGNGGGGNGGGGSGGTWEDVRVTLPARCHFPHAIAGTYYDYLNVKRHCAPKDIEASYRGWRGQGYKAAKAIDQSRADAMDRLVVEARLVLGNPTMRAEYDALLPLEEGTVLPPPSRMGDEDSIW